MRHGLRGLRLEACEARCVDLISHFRPGMQLEATVLAVMSVLPDSVDLLPSTLSKPSNQQSENRKQRRDKHNVEEQTRQPRFTPPKPSSPEPNTWALIYDPYLEDHGT